eukprot:gene8449-10379_t
MNPYMSVVKEVRLLFSINNEIDGVDIPIERLSLFIDKIRIPKGSFGESLEKLEIDFPYINYSDFYWSKENVEKEVMLGIIVVGSIPSQCQELTIDFHLLDHKPLELIPSSVKKLNICGWNSKEIGTNLVPPTVQELKILTFYKKCKEPILISNLPPSITLFMIMVPFSGSIVKLPSSIKCLKFYFKQDETTPIGIIPPSVENLVTSCHDIVPGMIPNGVKDLFLVLSGSQPFKGAIPESVTKLTLGSSENYYELDGTILPTRLTHLTIKQTGYPRISLKPDIYYCKNLIYLDFHVRHPIEIGMLPPSLKILVLRSKTRIKLLQPGSLPNELENLILDIYGLELETLEEGVLPNNLKSLAINIKILEQNNFPLLLEQFYFPPTLNQLEFRPNENRKRGLSLYFKNLELFMTKLFSISKSTLEIRAFDTKFISFDSKDPYLYYNNESKDKEGFILKSKINEFR